jgi:glycosyltransferase involved in cell wall biosynthesis
MLRYNSEKEIENALESVTWADEIIVIYSFSEDGSVEIAGKYTDGNLARVVSWKGRFRYLV